MDNNDKAALLTTQYVQKVCLLDSQASQGEQNSQGRLDSQVPNHSNDLQPSPRTSPRPNASQAVVLPSELVALYANHPGYIKSAENDQLSIPTCRSCGGPVQPGVNNTKIRIKSGQVTLTCGVCLHTTKLAKMDKVSSKNAAEAKEVTMKSNTKATQSIKKAKEKPSPVIAKAKDSNNEKSTPPTKADKLAQLKATKTTPAKAAKAVKATPPTAKLKSGKKKKKTSNLQSFLSSLNDM